MNSNDNTGIIHVFVVSALSVFTCMLVCKYTCTMYCCHVMVALHINGHLAQHWTSILFTLLCLYYLSLSLHVIILPLLRCECLYVVVVCYILIRILIRFYPVVFFFIFKKCFPWSLFISCNEFANYNFIISFKIIN